MAEISMGRVPEHYAKSWGDLSKRREKFGRADNRDRTESELQIEKSLGQKVSLHFHDYGFDTGNHIQVTLSSVMPLQ